MKLENKAVVVTGASSGIGRAVAQLMLEKGARVVLAARREQELRDIANDGRWRDRAFAIPVDLANATAIPQFSAQVHETLGSVDIVVHAAGVGYSGALDDLEDFEFELGLKVNLLAPMLLCKYLLPLMQSTEEGALVFINSMASLVPTPKHYLYTATKFGLHGFCASMVRESRSSNLSIVEVFPGATKSQMITDGLVKHAKSQGIRMVARSTKTVASDIVLGLERREKRVYSMGLMERGMVLLEKIAPWLVDLFIKRHEQAMHSTLCYANEQFRQRSQPKSIDQ